MCTSANFSPFVHISNQPTDKIPPGLVLVALFPVARPRHQHGVVLEAAQAAGLEQVGSGVPQVGRDRHLTEALHLLGLHQFT